MRAQTPVPAQHETSSSSLISSSDMVNTGRYLWDASSLLLLPQLASVHWCIMQPVKRRLPYGLPCPLRQASRGSRLFAESLALTTPSSVPLSR
jgi:hypothetical protein